MKFFVVFTALALIAVGCGESEATPEDSIRAAAIEFADLLKDNKIASACDLTPDRQKCISAMALAKSVYGSEFTSLIPDDYTERVEKATVTITGDSATINMPDDPQKMVKQDGKWLVEIEETS